MDLVRRTLERQGRRPPAVLPRHYVRFGDVLVLDVPDSLRDRERETAAAYAQTLGCRSVVEWMGGIEGELRQPRARLLWGDPATETLHREHGIAYWFDPMRLMWSPGNKEQRRRVAGWDLRGKVAVDMFAGIGYFTLPMAVHARADRVIAIEKNPVAHEFLQRNIAANGVADRVEAILGDNRLRTPRGAADHVVLGYLHDTLAFVPVAVQALRPEGGILHVHCKADAAGFPQRAFDGVEACVRSAGAAAQLQAARVVKSYAPRVVHGVLDVEVRPSGS